MILECPSCHARYLVPIGLFAQGGRHVRCARCKNDWHATLPTTIDVFTPAPAIVTASAPPVFSAPPVSSSLKSAPASAPGTSPVIVPAADKPSPFANALPAAASAIEAQMAVFATHAAQLPAVIEKWNTKFDIKKYVLYVVAVIVVIGALLTWPIMAREKIVKAIPSFRGMYESMGFYISHSGKGLEFDDVKSEIRYDGGTMRLYVDGVIHNTTDDIQFVPDIKARALGPDRHIIQSWWVPSPTPTIGPNGDAPFHTEVNTPMNHTIEDVYLEFYAEDEKGDVAQ